MSVFVNMEMCSYGILAYSLLPIIEYLPITLLSSHEDKFFHIRTLLRDISLSWGVICTLLDKINTWFFYISSFPVIIYFSMLLMTIMFLKYRSLQRVHIHQKMILYMRMWLIIWDMVRWRQWNEKMDKICDDFYSRCGEEHEMYDDT